MANNKPRKHSPGQRGDGRPAHDQRFAVVSKGSLRSPRIAPKALKPLDGPPVAKGSLKSLTDPIADQPEASHPHITPSVLRDPLVI
mgnify:CR=1 FL=1